MDLLLLQRLQRPFGPGYDREIELPRFVGAQLLLQRTEQNFRVGRLIVHQEDMECLTFIFPHEPALSCPTGSPVSSTYSGNVKKNVAPLSGSDSTHTRPLYSSMIFFTMVNPIPVPGTSLWPRRSNGSKIRSTSDDGIPMPLSRTNTAVPFMRFSTPLSTSGGRPSTEKFRAFRTRLSSTWKR